MNLSSIFSNQAQNFSSIRNCSAGSLNRAGRAHQCRQGGGNNDGGINPERMGSLQNLMMMQQLSGFLMGMMAAAGQGQNGNAAMNPFGAMAMQAGTVSNDQADSIPTTELQRGQSRDFGKSHVSVDANGGLNFSQDGAKETSFESGASINGNSCGQFSANAFSKSKTTQKAGQSLRVENGQIHLPNGKTIPFNNTGAIVIMPDGTQVAVGRNSANSGEQCRWVVADKGQQIPCSPPGATSVYRLNEAGDVCESTVR
jgi:hypothetical protein